jgi:type II secretory ATPase GspE/PulE/Tfp pilus assembly ATPase PilB-like protein
MAALPRLPQSKPAPTALRLELVDIDVPGALGETKAAVGAVPVLLAPLHSPRPLLPGASIATFEHLDAALGSLEGKPLKRLGEALVESGRVRQEQVDQALEAQRAMPGRQLGEILVAMGTVTAEQVKTVLADKLGIPKVDAKQFPVSDETRSRIPVVVCVRHRMMPIAMRNGALVVAMDNPLSSEALEAARFACGLRVVPVLANGEEIREVLRLRGGGANLWQQPTVSAEPTAQKSHATQAASPAFGSGDALEFDLTGVEALASRLTQELVRHDHDGEESDSVRDSDSTLVRLVNKIILDAHESNASDVHIEPAPKGGSLRVRMRRDGVLADYAELPGKFRAALISRVKIMANLDISEKRRPQDGKIDFSKFGPARLELRVATIPTNNGRENVVLRLLAASEPVPIERLGLEAGILERLRAIADRPHGLLLVCGPTGSGKTTTLHSLVASINTPERKIWTAEDPVEITQPGLCQVQVNPKIDWGFAAALRSFLRADPDVIMVGEMRDAETASTAVEASLTGHLVLSTLHTNSAPETVTRLLDLGLDPFNFGDSLAGVLAQRLVRRVCSACGVSHKADARVLEPIAEEYAAGTTMDRLGLVRGWLAEGASLAHGPGCEGCGGSGFKGRVAVHEFMEVTPGLRALVHKRANAEALRTQAIADGMRTLRQDGIAKVLAGQTTLSQVRSATA